jgi:hypothetical protein
MVKFLFFSIIFLTFENLKAGGFRQLNSYDIPDNQFIYGGYNIETGEMAFVSGKGRNGGHGVARGILEFGADPVCSGQNGKVAGFGFMKQGGNVFLHGFSSLKGAGDTGEGSSVNGRLPNPNPVWGAMLPPDLVDDIFPALANELDADLVVDDDPFGSKMFPYNRKKHGEYISPIASQLIREQTEHLQRVADRVNADRHPEPFGSDDFDFMGMSRKERNAIRRNQRATFGTPRPGAQPKGQGALNAFLPKNRNSKMIQLSPMLPNGPASRGRGCLGASMRRNAGRVPGAVDAADQALAAIGTGVAVAQAANEAASHIENPVYRASTQAFGNGLGFAGAAAGVGHLAYTSGAVATTAGAGVATVAGAATFAGAATASFGAGVAAGYYVSEKTGFGAALGTAVGNWWYGL